MWTYLAEFDECDLTDQDNLRMFPKKLFSVFDIAS
jgi:hypothetical protein